MQRLPDACPITGAVADAVATELRRQEKLTVVHPTYMPGQFKGSLERTDMITVRWVGSRRGQPVKVGCYAVFTLDGDCMVVGLMIRGDELQYRASLEHADVAAEIVEWLLRYIRTTDTSREMFYRS